VAFLEELSDRIAAQVVASSPATSDRPQGALSLAELKKTRLADSVLKSVADRLWTVAAHVPRGRPPAAPSGARLPIVA
jgi:hypothetical protein